MEHQTELREEMVGRGSRQGGRLLRGWFEGLGRAAEQKEQAAYVFVMGSCAEILRVFDLPTVFPEINSLQTAVRGVAQDYLNQAEEYGYSPDICGYVKADLAVQLRGGEHPMARIPRPALAILTNACNTYIKWGEIWERLYGIPVFTFDVPGTRSATDNRGPGDPSLEADRRYVEEQIRELIALCERVTGRAFDIDRLRDAMARTNEMNQAWKRVLDLNRARPAVFNALTEGTIYLGVANALRGTAEGSRYFRELVEELEYKATRGIGTLTDEKWRLTFVGVPCYPIFRRFCELFTEWGGVFVNSVYLSFASGGLDFGTQYDLARPIESLAEVMLTSLRTTMDQLFFQEQALVDMVERFSVDGIVYHPIKSCRTVSTGLADKRRAVMAIRDIPSLFIESDLMDKRVVSEAQLKNRIDAFFEGLASRKLRAAAAAHGH
jgi:benzoyl-CoA reductase subunit B